MKQNGDLVFPGDEVAIAEEFVPGPGTYEEAGLVHAAWIGELELDSSDFIARVRPRGPTPVTLQEGDDVIGVIRALRESMAIVDVDARVDAPDREVAGDTNGTLHIAKIADFFIDNIEDAFRVGDIIRAHVTGVSPSVQITTKPPEYGVVKARCPRCRQHMDAKGRNGLLCPECGWKETGKVSTLYGTGEL